MKKIVRSVAVVDYGMGNLRSVAQAVIHAATDTGVDLVEHHGGAFSGRGQHDFEREHHARQLTARRTLGQRQHVRTAVRRETELDGVDAIVAGVPGARLAVVPDAADPVHLTAPEAFNAELWSFLDAPA